MKALLACLVLALVPGCVKAPADDGSTSADDDSTSASDDSTSASDGSTSDGSPTADDGSTTDICAVTDLEQCEASVLCPSIEVAQRPAPNVYADSEVCAFTALRDRSPGLLQYNDCAGSGCSSATFLTLADGRSFGDFGSFDAETGTSNYGRPVPCELPAPAVFAACLAAFDPKCTWAEFIAGCRRDEPMCECP